MKNTRIELWLNTTTSTEYSIDKKELIEKFRATDKNEYDKEELNEKLAEFLQEKLDLGKIREFDSFEEGETRITDSEDLVDINPDAIDYQMQMTEEE